MNKIGLTKAFWCGVALCSLVLLLPTGCLSYRTGGMPDVELQRIGSAPESRPIVVINVRSRTRDFGESVLRDNVAASQSFKAVLAKVFDQSNVFKTYTFDGRRTTDANLRVEMELTSTTTGASIAVALSAVTLTIIPETETETHRLSVQVFDDTGNRRGRYEIEDSMRTWVQLAFLPLGSRRSPEKTRRQLMENLIRAALSRMKADGLLIVPPSQTPGPGPDGLSPRRS